MSVLEFYLGKFILGFNFPLFYLMFSTEFSTPHPDLKLILGHHSVLTLGLLQRLCTGGGRGEHNEAVLVRVALATRHRAAADHHRRGRGEEFLDVGLCGVTDAANKQPAIEGAG